MCAIAAIKADVSHLVGHGYNYDKPTTKFDLPQFTSAPQQPITTPSNEYLSPQSHFTAAVLQPGAVQIHHEEHHEISQGSASKYLPPKTQGYAAPVYQQEISQLQYTAPAAPVFHQPITESHYAGPASAPVVQGPAGEYSPPLTQQSTPVTTPLHTDFAQLIHAVHSHYTSPGSSPVHQQQISQGPDLSQPQYTGPISQLPIAPTPRYLPAQIQLGSAVQVDPQLVSTQHVTTPVNEYLPPQQQHNVQVTAHQQQIPQTVSQLQYAAPIQAPFHHQEIPQTVAQSQYMAPTQGLSAVQHHQDVVNTVTVSQPQYSVPIQAPVHQAASLPENSALALHPVQHQETLQAVSQPQYSAPVIQPISTPPNDYLAPQQYHHAAPQITSQHPALTLYQELPQQFAKASIEYLPPTEHHHQHEEIIPVDHHQESHVTSQDDGYHYDVPVKNFHF